MILSIIVQQLSRKYVFGIGHAVLPAGKQFAAATLHNGFFVLVMQIPSISGPRRVCFCEIREGKRIVQESRGVVIERDLA